MQTLLALFSVDDITGFQITNLVELPEPYGIIFLWGAVFPAIFIFVASITNFVFKDNLILKVCNHVGTVNACHGLQPEVLLCPETVCMHTLSFPSYHHLQYM